MVDRVVEVTVVLGDVPRDVPIVEIDNVALGALFVDAAVDVSLFIPPRMEGGTPNKSDSTLWTKSDWGLRFKLPNLWLEDDRKVLIILPTPVSISLFVVPVKYR